MVNKKKIKNYEVTLDSEVIAISLVEHPAIEMDYVYLSKEESQLVYLEKDEKHLLVGCVLRPDFPIYRYSKGEEFYLQFSKEVIEKLAYEYMQNGRIYSFTTDHKDITDNISVVESWLKTSDNDKSNDFGINAPVGSWLIAAKVEDDEIWQRVKNGELKGFSVESFVNLEEIMIAKTDNQMVETNLETIEVNESFWVKIATIIKEALKSPETPELEAQVTAAMVIDDIQEEVHNPEEVVEEPIVAEEVPTEEVVEEPTEIVEETPVAETPIEEPVVEEAVEESVVEEPIAVEEPVADLQVTIDELNAMIDELNAKIADLEKENVKLSKQPSAEPVKINGSNGNSCSNFDRMLAIMDGTAFRK